MDDWYETSARTREKFARWAGERTSARRRAPMRCSDMRAAPIRSSSPARVSESASYEDPLDFCRRLDSEVEAEHGRPSQEIEFALEDLPAVRRAVGALAREAGLPAERTEELVMAVNEVTTNAVLHGRPPATVRTWRTGGEFVVGVSDAGDGIRDAFAGQLTPPPAGLGGRGLWLTRLLCEAVEVRCDDVGCTVTMRAAVPGGDRPLTAV